MSPNCSWIFAVVAFAFVIESGAALRCWTCTSDRSPECGDPMNATQHHRDFHTRDCDANANPGYSYNTKFVCKKRVDRDNGRLVVKRSCEIQNPDDHDGLCGSHETPPSHVTIASCHTCTTDLCNSATSLSGSQILFLTAIVAIASRFIPAVRSI